VLSTNSSGTAYNMNIPEQFTYVAQAVALNEHRGKTWRGLPGSVGAFPLESIMGMQALSEQTRIERGFIGAHADIGGGFAESESQLSQVALIWMVEQAKNAGVKMEPTPSTIIAHPVIHDKSDNQYATTAKPVSPGIEDRVVHYQDGKTTSQMAMKDTGMTWSDTLEFISYLPVSDPPPGAVDRDGKVIRVPRSDFVTGTVDMQGYLQWINRNGYNVNLRVQ
jgi:hypothetical protein